MYPMGQIPMRQRALGGKVPDVVPSCGVESTSCVWGGCGVYHSVESVSVLRG